MTRRVVKNIDFLELLQCSSKSERERLLAGAKSDQINAICDCIKNILLGNVEITSAQKSRLRPKKELLRKLANKKTKTKDRKRLLIQHGGAGGLLPILLGTVGSSLISNILPKIFPG